MTTPRKPSARCDEVLALIDACLEEVGSGLVRRGAAPRTCRLTLTRQHLTLISG